MYPFWDLAISPALQAAQARCIVEIGALRGETTAFMLNELGAGAELHVIDPVPVFDPSEQERQFPGRYHFYRDLSVNVLPSLPPMDAALIDGDHNWYTVHRELELLHDTSRREGEVLPLLFLHDVGWPYGRRDLYYAPEQIPEEFRQPYRQAGMMRGVPELLKRGGMNPTMNNAVMEGGPRNGVMTAVDDFVASYPGSLRQVVLPAYFGLAILVDQRRLDDHPALGEHLDFLEASEGQRALVELAEDTRLKAITVQHGVFFNSERRHGKVAARYLDTVKAALRNEHYLEHEVRIDHLLQVIEDGAPLHGENLRDPIRQLKMRTATLREARRAGRLRVDDDDVPGYFPLTTMGEVRLDRLQACLDTIRSESVKGDLVDCATGRGGAAILMKAYLEAYDMPDPTLWVIDRFSAASVSTDVPAEGAAGSAESPDRAPGRRDGEDPPAIPGGGRGLPDLLADLNNVRDALARFDLYDGRVRFLHGEYASSVPAAPVEKIALLRLGPELGVDAGVVLDHLYDRVTVGGVVFVDGVADDDMRRAVDDFRQRRGIEEPVERVDWTSVTWRKVAFSSGAEDGEETSGDGAPARPVVPPADPLHQWAPPAPPIPLGRCDLSVVVVFYNMKREAERTLHSLSRAYQRDVDDLDYEVVVVENGSDQKQKLGKKYVRSFGPEFRYLDLADDALPSPVSALNYGISKARGDAFALMIDGAHVLTPGVLHYGALGLRTYDPAIVATQQWYMGPGQQGDVMDDGYDQDFEDRLFDEIKWPTDGYRLFDVGNFIGERDWLDGLWESNCLFVSRRLLQQIGGFDESFSMAGGGFANLDIYERLGASPDVTVATVLGEGSFHQVHGGTTTNLPDIDERHARLASYAEHFADLRGRGFRGHGKKIHYIGTMLPEAARTRARRRYSAETFARAADGPDGRPDRPVPIHQELRADFIDAYWRSLRWRDTQWLGRRIPKPPTDLFAYQELIHRVRPDFVIETGTGNGGRAQYLATVCDLVGHGEVISIDAKEVEGRPTHPRLTYVTGIPHDPKLVTAVMDQVGEPPNALVILGSRTTAGKTLKEFNHYSPLVPVGSYVVVEDTIVNGHPVWANFGRGPAEAVKGIVEGRGDFAADLTMEKYVLTFNPGGFLKRVS